MSNASIIIAGDLFPTEENVSYFSKGDINSLFGEKIIQLFQDADLTICNLEGALTDHRDICKKTGPVKVAQTSAIEAYKQLGIKCCLLANNHTTDGGHQGVLDTMKALEEAEIDYMGAGINDATIIRAKVYEIGGINVGIYNVSETMYNKPLADKAGAWLYDEYVVCNDIKELKQKCDYLIVIYHGGIEKFQYPSPEVRKRFHRMADCGANAVITQHTHCIGCEEYYKDSWLLYGQGDFLLKNFKPGYTDSGLLLEFVIQNGKVEIKKHLVKSVDNLFVRYDENQDLSAFKERSKKVSDEQYVFNQLQTFCDGELKLYLAAFKSPSKLRILQRKIFPEFYKKWLFKYNQRDLMFALHTLRSEQNRETAIIGLEELLRKQVQK